MNDRYLCRAKRINNGEWAIGYYAKRHGIPMIYENKDCPQSIYEVDPSTICQCIGLNDKNGKLIWENDIVKINGVVYICFWNKSNFEWGFKNNAEDFGVAYIPSDDIRIAGNIFDNSELLEVGE